MIRARTFPALARALLLAVAGAPLAAQATSEVEELARECADGEGREQRRACEELEERGPEASPQLLTFLGSRIASRRDDALRAVVASWPVDAVVSSVVRAPDAGDGLAQRMRTVRRLGTLGDARAVGDLLTVASGLAERHRKHPSVQREIQGALDGILQRDAGGLRALARAAPGFDPALLVPVARAMGTAGRGGALDALVRLLGRDEELDRVLIESIGTLRPWDPDNVSGACGRTLSGFLSSPDSQTRRVAAVSLGRLGDASYVEALLKLLASDDPRARSGASWALAQLSGSPLERDADQWQSWWREERDWFRDRAQVLADDARGDDPGVAFQAIRELAEHPVFALELAADLGDVVHHAEAGVARAACQALGRLGGPRVFAPLVDALGDSRPEVRQAATAALRSLTDAPLVLTSPDSWTDWLRG